MNRKVRTKWLRSLKIGDVVCDCRYEHLKISAIEEERWAPHWVRRLTRYFPARLGGAVETFCERVGITTLWDKNLVLEDGSHCSAINCCHPIPHPEYTHE